MNAGMAFWNPHTWIFSGEYFRDFAVASWKAKRVVKKS